MTALDRDRGLTHPPFPSLQGGGGRPANGFPCVEGVG